MSETHGYDPNGLVKNLLAAAKVLTSHAPLFYAAAEYIETLEKQLDLENELGRATEAIQGGTGQIND